MILMKDIIREGHPTLTKKAAPVKLPVSIADRNLGFSLLQYVINSQDDELAKKYGLRAGVGLAAPQINVSKRMFAMHVHDLDGKLYSMIVVNPVITHHSREMTYIPGGEGCLSVDRETEGITPRYVSIRMKAYIYDLQSNDFVLREMDLDGYPATVFQHEYDHLDGIMYTTKLYLEVPGATPLFDLYETEEDEI
ncbi:Peptide deformylase [Paracholeplasma brassicae]|uniref:Peptide deformylase n=1 Tax=Acholeplasma brassicae TaxID=61635 RepID=U4KS75_9MOLU|nr:peptide deformylase [Paracholeplasma brassicae]CCV66383.1 Peptide deformylase [Paracholeplasma brassicae]